MTWADYLIIGIIALSAVVSLIRGFTREILSLVAWIAAFWVAWTFFQEFAVRLEPWIGVPSVRLGAAFLILVLVTLLIGGLVNYLVCQLVEKTGIGGTDRLIGMFFGAARGALLVGILVLLAGLTALPKDPWWRASQLLPYFQDLALWLRDWLPADVATRFSYG